MARYYKLIDAVDAATTFHLPHRGPNGAVYNFYTLRPGVKYSEHADDDLFVYALKEECHKRMLWTQEREDMLKAAGVRYNVVKGCGSCSGSRKNLDVWIVEVVE